jgi:predicted RNase H-like HicB family nuclease
MRYKLPVIITKIKNEYLARCEEVRATATGDSPEDAVNNLREAIDEMINEYGQEAVFQDVGYESQLRLIEVAV